MKKFIAIAIVGSCFPGAAFAQSCVTSTGAGNAPSKTCLSGGVPKLSGLTGNVSVVRNGSILQAIDGMQLKSGDRIVTRPTDSGTFAMSGAQGGSCSLPLASSTVTITQSGGSTCFSERKTVISNSQAQAPSSALPPPAPVAVATAVSEGVSPLVLAVGGAALAGGAAIAISQSSDKNNRLSP